MNTKTKKVKINVDKKLEYSPIIGIGYNRNRHIIID